MMRAMVLEFPDDPGCAHLERQYIGIVTAFRIRNPRHPFPRMAKAPPLKSDGALPTWDVEVREDLLIVEMAGIEPASTGAESGLLRVQFAAIFSAPAITRTSRRRAQSLFDFPSNPVTGLDGLVP